MVIRGLGQVRHGPHVQQGGAEVGQGDRGGDTAVSLSPSGQAGQFRRDGVVGEQ